MKKHIQLFIALNVEDDQIQHIRNCKSAREAWNILKEIYEKDSPSNRVHILRTIMRQRLEEDGDAEKHVNNMHELFQKLMALGGDINPEFFMSATLMGSLPESYDGLITALEARSEDDLTSSLVRSKIISEYRRRLERKGVQDDVALRVNSVIKGNEEVSCYFCKMKGHIKKNCIKYQNWLKRRGNNYQKANLAEGEFQTGYLFGTQQMNGGWIVDSGATCHIVGSRDAFIDFDSTCREKVSVASGQQLTAVGKGTVKVEFLNDFNQTTSVKIGEVLLMPEIKGNLLSVKNLTENGFEVHFVGQKCEIKKDNWQVAVGSINNNLYNLRESHKAYIVDNDSNGCVHTGIQFWVIETLKL